MFLTDSGLETDLIFNDGFEHPAQLARCRPGRAGALAQSRVLALGIRVVG